MHSPIEKIRVCVTKYPFYKSKKEKQNPVLHPLKNTYAKIWTVHIIQKWIKIHIIKRQFSSMPTIELPLVSKKDIYIHVAKVKEKTVWI